MKLGTHILYPAFAFRQYNNQAELTGCVTVAALFEVNSQGICQSIGVQPEIRLTDELIGPEDPPLELKRQADFLPFKPGTDVTVLAEAVAPSGRPEQSWYCGIRGAGLEARLRVHGPRRWQEIGRLVQPGPAEPVSTVRLSWRSAWGGAEVGADGKLTGEVDSRNPIGAGYAARGAERAMIGVLVPQVEAADEPIVSVFHASEPAGVAPVAPISSWRANFAGTYDEKWQKTVHPFLPRDFDPRFYQCAPPLLRSANHLCGDEKFEMVNLHAKYPRLSVSLPSLAFGAVASYRDGNRLRMPLALDGVHFELLGPKPQVRLTWRTSFLWYSGITAMDVGALDFDSLHHPTPDAAYAG
ncbi:DUF2169 family type VI secretion system accessory protein [Paracoccus tegillarcae]|nr:DUF2169 domain-containing protein [Paracoccus tegillarcae]